MRAIFYKNLDVKVGETVEVEGEKHHHLSRVVRLKKGEEVLLLHKRGYSAISRCESIDRKKIQLKVLSEKEHQDTRSISLLLAPPKKSAFEEVVKLATELGVREVLTFKSDFSQELDLENPRLEKIIEMAAIQSNNPFGLELRDLGGIDKAATALKDYKQTFLLSPRKVRQTSIQFVEGDNKALIIGPEGGFSEIEEDLFINADARCLRIGENILRTPTAIVAGFGAICTAIKT